MGKSNSNYDGEVVIANDYFVFNGVIYQQEELEIYGGGGGGGITPPVSETKMVNETKGLNILWFFGYISKNIPPYRVLRGKYVMDVKGGKQKLSNMKSLVKQVIRAAGITNRHDLVVRNWFPRKVVYLYLGFRHFFAFPCFSSDKKRRYEKISWKTYYNALSKLKNYLGSSDGMSRSGAIGLVLQ